MSLDKAIQHGKERRKEYRGAKAVDATCRNHGTDCWSAEDRQHKHRKRKERCQSILKEYEEKDE